MIFLIAASAHALEIRGAVAGAINGYSNLDSENAFTWNPQNFAGFSYDIDRDEGSETLTTTLTGYQKLSGDAPYGIIYEASNQIAAYKSAQLDMIYGKLRVASIDNIDGKITLDNKDNAITLSKNKDTELMPRIYLRVADNDTLRYYIYKEFNDPGTYEIRGAVAGEIHGASNLDPTEDSFTWSPQNFAGFYYDIKKDIGTETLKFVLTGDEKKDKLSGDDPRGIIYTTSTQGKAFQRDLWGSYKVIGFQAEKYFAGYNEGVDEYYGSNIFYKESTDKNSLAAEQLEKILIDEKTKTIVKKGESIKLKEGYELLLKGVSDGGKIFLELRKDGKSVDEAFAAPSRDSATEFDKTYYYKNPRVGEQRNLVTIGVHFMSTYKDEEQALALVDGLWQISETPVDVKADTQYDKMTIRSVDASNGVITMDNKDNAITLNKKSDIVLMPGLNLRTADNETLRFYIYRTEVVK